MKYSELDIKTKKELQNLETPFLLFDLDLIKKNYTSLKEHFPYAKIFYALKANKNHQVLKVLHQAGCGFEINNENEFHEVGRFGVSAKDTINSAPVKSVTTIKNLYQKGLRVFVFDSVEEALKIKQYAPNAKVFLRIHTSNKGSKQHLNTKFGAHFEDAEKLIEYAKGINLEMVGITFTVGSQCQNLNNWEEGLKRSSNLFNKFAFLTIINIGGGLPINYNGHILDIKEISNLVKKTLKENFRTTPEIILEPGRFLVGGSALTATSVIGTKTVGKRRWAFVDASVFGSFLEILEFNIKYPVESEKEGRNYRYAIAGPTCDGTDIIDKKALLPKLELGDRVYFGNTGAYTLEYASPFNGFPIPKAYFMKEGKVLK